MASDLTTYQRQMLERENAIGVVAIYAGDGAWFWKAYDSGGLLATAPGAEGDIDEDVMRAGMAWAAEKHPDRRCVAMA